MQTAAPPAPFAVAACWWGQWDAACVALTVVALGLLLQRLMGLLSWA